MDLVDLRVIQNNCLHIVEWLSQIADHSIDLLNQCNRYNSLITTCIGGHLELLKWFQQHNLFGDINVDKVMNVDVMIKTRDGFQCDFKQLYKSTIHEWALQTCCTHGHLELAQWILQYCRDQQIPLNLHVDNEIAFVTSCQNGHLNIAQWIDHICQEDGQPIDLSFIDEHYEIIKWLYQKKNYQINLNCLYDYPFIDACQSGHLDLIQWFNSQNLPINVDCYIEAFKQSCLSGNLKVAEWFDQIDQKSNYQLISNNQFDLTELFEINYGHFKIAQWLDQIALDRNLQLNWLQNNYKILKSLCAFRHLEFAKWIYYVSIERGIPINIRQNNDYIFRTSCQCRSVHIANWVSTLCQDYQIESDIDDESIIFSWKNGIIVKRIFC